MLRKMYFIHKRLSLACRSFYENLIKKESPIKGEEFEQFLREKFYSPDEYILIQKTHNFNENKRGFIKSSLNPDFLYLDKKSREEFYVEAKYRGKKTNNRVSWCDDKQFNRYKEFAKDKTTYIALGICGRPSFPKELYIINLNDINGIVIDLKDFKKDKKDIPRGILDFIKDTLYN